MKDERREAARDAAYRYLDWDEPVENDHCVPEYTGYIAGYIVGYDAGKPKWIPIRSADDLAQPAGLYWVTCQIDGRRFTATAALSIDDELPGNTVAFCRISEPEPYTEGE